jgi:hypothetical protein
MFKNKYFVLPYVENLYITSKHLDTDTKIYHSDCFLIRMMIDISSLQLLSDPHQMLLFPIGRVIIAYLCLFK